MFHLKKTTKIESVPSENEHVGDDDGIDGDDDGIDGDDDGNDGGQKLMTPKRADSSS